MAVQHVVTKHVVKRRGISGINLLYLLPAAFKVV
jgi:hypothetical protein